ncbi:transposase [Romeria aff. gracilis LEGE 07310]|uniref:Transposase n=1 Tax=Vasconcelosia minhoensis LEGE 07310 TaxID=915328 RepID=A0A8J7DPT9_9CYAN|nr:transposase [Romeria aff. gracilis LEGE 07310]
MEGTWTWLENARILNRDYERLPEKHEGMIYVVMIRWMYEDSPTTSERGR